MKWWCWTWSSRAAPRPSRKWPLRASRSSATRLTPLRAAQSNRNQSNRTIVSVCPPCDVVTLWAHHLTHNTLCPAHPLPPTDRYSDNLEENRHQRVQTHISELRGAAELHALGKRTYRKRRRREELTVAECDCASEMKACATANTGTVFTQGSRKMHMVPPRWLWKGSTWRQSAVVGTTAPPVETPCCAGFSFPWRCHVIESFCLFSFATLIGESRWL